MAFSSGSSLVQSDTATTGGGGGSVAAGGGGGVSSWDELTGTLSGDVPFETVDSDGNPVSRGAAFSDDLSSGPTIRWDRDPGASLALRVRDEANGQTLLTLDESGNLIAQGDVSAFGSGSGGGGGTSDFQAGRSLTLDTGTSPSTLNVNLSGSGDAAVSTDGSGDYVVDVTVPVDTVFGRTGAITAQSGDYTHAQISGISSDDHHTRYTGSEARGAVEGTSDVADLSGALGTSGQVPQSNGTGVSWTSLSAADLSNVSADSASDAHHAKYTDENAQDAVGAMVDTTLAYTDSGPTLSVVGDNVDAGSVDGYEGSELAVLAEDETVTGRWDYEGNTNVNSISDLTSSGNNQPSDWSNNDRLRVTGANNTITFVVPSVTNKREAAIQVGHEEAQFSNAVGKLYLNPVGGDVITNQNAGFGGDRFPDYAVDADGQIRAQSGLRVSTTSGDYQIQGDGSGNLEILTPAGNRQKFFDDGDFGAFK